MDSRNPFKDVRATGTKRAPDLAEVGRALAVLADPEQGLQLQALPSGRHRIVKGDDWGAIDKAVEWLSDEKGVYWSLNPCDRNREEPIDKAAMLCRRWVLIDADAVRPKDTNATDQEKEEAKKVVSAVQEWLISLGWPLPIWVDSGNGWHLLYRVDLPNDKESHELVRKAIKALAERFDTEAVTIDRKVHNANRISKLPGTWACKGPGTKERPHRMAHLRHVPEPIGVVTADQLSVLAGKEEPKTVEVVNPFELKATGKDWRPYVRGAIEREVGRIVGAPVGDRNNTLNKSAFALGQLVGAGVVFRQDVESALLLAAFKAELEDDEAKRTIASGLEAGIKTPRQLPDDKRMRKDRPSVNGVPHAKTEREKPTIYRITDILDMDIPPPSWAVPGLLSEGLSILAGKPKLGKSWMALNLALTIAAGGQALGYAKTEPGDVLYLSLEDRLRRVQDRARKLLKGIGCAASSRLCVAVAWPRAHEGGLEELESWLEQASNPKLVIIDVWQKFRPPLRQGSQYEQDYEAASQVKTVADSFHSSLLAVHHCKKAAAEDVMDEISGTLGLSGAADGLMVLTRARNENEGALHITGRDVDEKKLAVEFDPKTFAWKCHGDADSRSNSKVQHAILGVMRSSGGSQFFPGELADLLDKEPGTVRKQLQRMFQDGILRKIGSKYALPLDDMASDELGEHPFG